MGNVIFDISMSLDGFMTAAGQTAEEPMGRGGERLTEWAFGSDERDREILTTGVAGLGSVICGRRTYDTSLPWWGSDGPTGPARVPVFVLSHGEPEEVPEGGVYTFVDGIEPALDAAREAAGDRYVTVMGGAETGQQFLRADLSTSSRSTSCPSSSAMARGCSRISATGRSSWTTPTRCRPRRPPTCASG